MTLASDEEPVAALASSFNASATAPASVLPPLPMLPLLFSHTLGQIHGRRGGENGQGQLPRSDVEQRA